MLDVDVVVGLLYVYHLLTHPLTHLLFHAETREKPPVHPILR